MKTLRAFSIVALAAITMTGCVKKSEYESLLNEKKNIEANYQIAANDLSATRARLSSIEEQLKDCQNNVKYYQTTLGTSVSAANQNSVNVAKLAEQIKDANQYIRHLQNLKSKSDSLNMVLTNNLTKALTNEEKKDVDVKVLKGVVYVSLSDNMLYKSGSYEINERAAETLSKVAKIIQDYPTYSVIVEGNTDNVPISKTNIRNNWDLSALRASSVVQCLQTQYNVDPKRMTAGGRGEYNPVAENTTDAGKQRNRRTQIIITPELGEFMELIGQAPQEETVK